MAHRGRPIPFSLREQIKADRRDGHSVRAVAMYRNVSKTTVQKYGSSLVQAASNGTSSR